MSKVYESLKVGDKIICTMARAYFIVGDTYIVDKLIENHRPVIRDIDGDSVVLSADDFMDNVFVLKNSEEHEQFKEFINLKIGELVKAFETSAWFKEGESYEILSRRNTGTLITEDGLINFNVYTKCFNLPDPTETRHIQPHDYLSIIDLAIDTRDKEWFKELSALSAGGMLI